MENIKEKMEELRNLLHETINRGDVSEIITVSKEMDKTILEFLNFIKEQDQKPK